MNGMALSCFAPHVAVPYVIKLNITVIYEKSEQIFDTCGAARLESIFLVFLFPKLVQQGSAV